MSEEEEMPGEWSEEDLAALGRALDELIQEQARENSLRRMDE